MNRLWWEQRVGADVADAIEDRLAMGGRDVGDVLLEMRQDGVITPAQLRELLAALEAVVTLSEGPVSTQQGPLPRVSELGRGAMGTVHAARDTRLGRNVAVKTIDAAAAQNAVLARRFKAEAQITAQLDHPGIVPVYSLSVDARGLPSYSMKLIRGQTLAEYLATIRATHERNEPLDDDHDLAARLDVFLQVCNAVAYAHNRGVLHRDLKPDNVMLGAFHEVLVVDWGVAKLIGQAEDTLEGLPSTTAGEGTELGTVIGTPQYCSPEQARGENNSLDARSDQYALGLMLYEMVSLTRAYRGKTSYLALLKAANGDKEPLKHAYGERIPREVAAILRKATQVKPEHRYASVEALADDVRRHLRDEAVLAQPDSLRQRTGRWVARHRQATLALVGLLVAALLAVTLVTVVGGVVAREMAAQAAAEREQQLSRVLALSKERAGIIDAELFATESLVSGIASATSVALDRPVTRDRPIYRADAFGTEDGPPDLTYSPAYDADISLAHVDVHVPDMVPAERVQDVVPRLVALQPVLRRALLRSDGEALVAMAPEVVDRRIVEEGLTAVWTYVATESGVLAGYPGVGGYSSTLDPRQRPWYRRGFTGEGPQWSALSVEEGDNGLLLTCTFAIRDAQGRRVGVAAVDLAFDVFIERYLDPTDAAVPVEVWLVDEQDRVVVRSSQKDLAQSLTEYSPQPFPVGEVLSAMRRERVGHRSVDWEGQDTLFAWSPLSAVPWTVVVQVAEADVAGL